MTRDGLSEFLETIQRAFLSGETDVLGTHFVWPLVVYTMAGVTVIRDEKDFSEKAGQYLAALRALSVASSSLSVEQREPLMNNRFKATVRVTDYNANGDQVVGSLIRYFLVQNQSVLKVEMLEYVETPLTAVEVERIVH